MGTWQAYEVHDLLPDKTKVWSAATARMVSTVWHATLRLLESESSADISMGAQGELTYGPPVLDPLLHSLHPLFRFLLPFRPLSFVFVSLEHSLARSVQALGFDLAHLSGPRDVNVPLSVAPAYRW